MTEEEEILLTKAQRLHEIIENHPALSGMMTDAMHGYLEDVVNHGYKIREYRGMVRALPSDEMMEKHDIW